MLKRLGIETVKSVLGRRLLHINNAIAEAPSYESTNVIQRSFNFPTKLTTPPVTPTPSCFVRMPSLENDYLLEPSAATVVLVAVNNSHPNSIDMPAMDNIPESLEMTSILRKRKLKMNRHRHSKRIRALRFLSARKKSRL